MERRGLRRSHCRCRHTCEDPMGGISLVFYAQHIVSITGLIVLILKAGGFTIQMRSAIITAARRYLNEKVCRSLVVWAALLSVEAHAGARHVCRWVRAVSE